MGQIVRATGEVAEARALVSREESRFERMLDAAMPKLQRILPRAMSPERMYQLGLAAYKQTPALASCDPRTILSCLLKCTSLGLEPSVVNPLDQAYIVPKKGSAVFMLGYRGVLELVRRSGQVRSIRARTVRERDDFDYSLGTDEWIRHRPFDGDDAGQLTHVYLVAELAGGGRYINVLTRREVMAHKAHSVTPNGPCRTDEEAMWRKTAVHASEPWLPMSVEACDAIRADGSTPPLPDAVADIELPEPEPEPTPVPEPDAGDDEGLWAPEDIEWEGE